MTQQVRKEAPSYLGYMEELGKVRLSQGQGVTSLILLS